jgi:hypothetical protein
MASVIEAVKNVTLGTEDGPLFEPLKVGDYQLSARYVHAPLTRCRALGKLAFGDFCRRFSCGMDITLCRQ